MYIRSLLFALTFLASLRGIATPLGSSATKYSGVKSKLIKSIQINDLYSILTYSDGMRQITEYTNRNNIVFAVRWSGQGNPNLKEVLGDHLPSFLKRQSEQRYKRIRNHSLVVSDKLRVSVNGHGSSITGLAYLTDVTPEGVNPESLND